MEYRKLNKPGMMENGKMVYLTDKENVVTQMKAYMMVSGEMDNPMVMVKKITKMVIITMVTGITVWPKEMELNILEMLISRVNG